jgi:hypothetical protein
VPAIRDIEANLHPRKYHPVTTVEPVASLAGDVGLAYRHTEQV